MLAVDRVLALTVRAGAPAVVIHFQSYPALAHPSGDPGGGAQHEGVVRHVLGDHGAGADEGETPHGVTADEGRVRAERGAPAHERGAVLVLARDMATRIDHVGEHHGGTAKDVVFQDHALVHRYVVLDLDVVANDDVAGHEHIRTEATAATDPRHGTDLALVTQL